MNARLFLFVLAAATGCTASVTGDPYATSGSGDTLGVPPTDNQGPVSGGDAAGVTDDGLVTPDQAGDGDPIDDGDDDEGDGDALPRPPHADADHPVPGAFWDNITNNLATITSSECGNAAAIFSSPWRDMLVTGVARHGLFASSDGGDSWVSIGAGGDPICNRMQVILFDPAHEDT